MSDAQLLELLDQIQGAPRILAGSWRDKYVYVDGRVVWMHRVGQGERFSFAPSLDVYDAAALPFWFPREVLTWARRHLVVDFSAYLRGMAARVQ